MKKYVGLILLTSKQERLRPVVNVIKLFFSKLQMKRQNMPNLLSLESLLEHFRCFPLRIRPWTFLLLTDQGGNACQGKMVKLIYHEHQKQREKGLQE
jgi:hypothetical protein